MTESVSAALLTWTPLDGLTLELLKAEVWVFSWDGAGWEGAGWEHGQYWECKGGAYGYWVLSMGLQIGFHKLGLTIPTGVEFGNH